MGSVVQMHRTGLRNAVNYAERSLAKMFPGYFTAAKHNHYYDYGFPTELSFAMIHGMYKRNGFAKAAVHKTVGKVWQTNPVLLEQEPDDGTEAEETQLESDIRQRFLDLRAWPKLLEAERRSLVGTYAGVVLRFADNKRLDEPVDRVPGGLEGLVEIIPAWEGQLTVSSWDDDQRSPNYGLPTMFQFNEAAVGDATKQRPRSAQIHPDRVIVWSEDGSVNGTSFLEPGFNDLINMEKIIGGGAEGFWKNAKSAPVLSIDKEIRLDDMLRMTGVNTPEQLVDAMNKQVEEWQKGFDKLLMVQGMTADALNITMPSPEHFFSIAAQSFAASVSIPLKILVGMQTGERASTEDAQEFAQTCMSFRTNRTIPNIRLLVNRLERVGILPEKDWYVDWLDLTETSMGEKIDRTVKMADVNQKMKDSGEFVFTPEEMRKAVDLEPLSEQEKRRDDPEDDDLAAAGAPTKTPQGGK